MAPAAALLAVMLAAGSEPGRAPSLRVRAAPDLAEPLAAASGPSSRPERSSPPPCVWDVCQPRVAVPGREPQLSIRGRRTELVLSMLDRTDVEPFATVARLLATTGLRVDFSPSAAATAGTRDGGWGRAEIGVRWRLDALNRPMWAGRDGG